jgi:hypothetical protein
MELLQPFLAVVVSSYQRCLRGADLVESEAQADARYAALRARDLAVAGDLDSAVAAAEEAAADDPHWQALLDAVRRADEADRVLLAAAEDAEQGGGLAWDEAARRAGVEAADQDWRGLYLRALGKG